MKRKYLIPMILVIVLSSLVYVMVSAGDDADAMVYVGHGIPGEALGFEDNALPVDVLVNDAICLLSGFKFGEFGGPEPLKAGIYNIKISLAVDEDPCSGDPVIEADVPFEAGETSTVIAHLTADGSPGAGDLLELGITASKFINDVSASEAGYTRLTVRHVAKAPAVDIKLYRGWERGRMVQPIEGLENPQQAGPLNTRPGAYEAVILAAGTSIDVLELQVEFMPHKSYLVYAVGGLDTETLAVLTQVIDDLDVIPPPPGPPEGVGPPEDIPPIPPEGVEPPVDIPPVPPEGVEPPVEIPPVPPMP
jgi:hypothetical protein